MLADNGETRASARRAAGSSCAPSTTSCLTSTGFGDFNPERIILNDPVARDSGEDAAPDAQRP